jgi:Methyltransferase domain
MIKSNPNGPTFVFDNLPLHWQMTRCEKYAFASLLEIAKPDVAIEIGTYKGGSLQIISQNAKRVYSIDKSPEYKEALSAHFANVELLTGNSRQLLPPLLDRIKAKNESLGFVLIDGDHSTEGVRNDVNAVLKYTPVRPLYIVFHDSFHPPSRKGILTADWHLCPFVHYVEVDFIPGVYHYEAFDTAKPRSMYGGLSLALMLPEERTHELHIYQSQKGLFDTILPHSRHGSVKESLILGFLRRVKRRLIG